MDKWIGLAAVLALVACQKNDGDGGETATAAKAGGVATAPMQKATVKNNGVAAPPSQPTSMPAGHPPTGGMPAGHPPAEGAAAGGMPADHPPAGGSAAGGMPAGHAAPAGAEVPTGPSGTISGTIDLDPALKDSVRAGSRMFVIARKAGERMPLAVRVTPIPDGGVFPLKYTLTQADAMVKGVPFSGDVTVEARIDGDGDAISKEAGDITGAAAGSHTVTPAGVTVDFKLDQKL